MLKSLIQEDRPLQILDQHIYHKYPAFLYVGISGFCSSLKKHIFHTSEDSGQIMLQPLM